MHAYRACVLSISTKNECWCNSSTTTAVSTNGSKEAATPNVWRGAVFRTVARKLVRFLACRFGSGLRHHIGLTSARTIMSSTKDDRKRGGLNPNTRKPIRGSTPASKHTAKLVWVTDMLYVVFYAGQVCTTVCGQRKLQPQKTKQKKELLHTHA